MQHKDDYVIVWQPLTTVSSHSKAGRWTRTWFLTHEFLNLLISSSQMSKNETQGQVLTIKAHASSTFSVLQIMRELSALRAQAARVIPVFSPEPSPGPGHCKSHGIMGSQSQIRSHKFDHTRTANTQVWPQPDCKSVWLAAVSPCRAPIGRLSPLHCLFTSPSCWGTHFLYLSNLLPIIPCLKDSSQTIRRNT